jgi:hypothetical protein
MKNVRLLVSVFCLACVFTTARAVGATLYATDEISESEHRRGYAGRRVGLAFCF